jgi:hypothetical protein
MIDDYEIVALAEPPKTNLYVLRPSSGVAVVLQPKLSIETLVTSPIHGSPIVSRVCDAANILGNDRLVLVRLLPILDAP